MAKEGGHAFGIETGGLGSSVHGRLHSEVSDVDRSLKTSRTGLSDATCDGAFMFAERTVGPCIHVSRDEAFPPSVCASSVAKIESPNAGLQHLNGPCIQPDIDQDEVVVSTTSRLLEVSIIDVHAFFFHLSSVVPLPCPFGS